MNYVLNRNYVLVTLTGKSIEFRKGLPTHVPPDCIRSAIGIGAFPADGSEVDVILEGDEPRLKKAPTDPVERQDAIMQVVRDLVIRNDRDDFTAAGLPSPKVISGILKWRVDLREVNNVYRIYNEELAINNEQFKLDARGK